MYFAFLLRQKICFAFLPAAKKIACGRKTHRIVPCATNLHVLVAAFPLTVNVTLKIEQLPFRVVDVS